MRDDLAAQGRTMQEVETHAFQNVAPRTEAIIARSRKGGQCLVDPTLCHVSPAEQSCFGDQPSKAAVPCQEDMAALSDDRMAGTPTVARADGANTGVARNRTGLQLPVRHALALWLSGQMALRHRRLPQCQSQGHMRFRR